MQILANPPTTHTCVGTALRAWPDLCSALNLPRTVPTPAKASCACPHFLGLCLFLCLAVNIIRCVTSPTYTTERMPT
uniref:Uncharacterized protein n=1 Tax=Aegilops tauschii subsp. strangulata TaxID=200361 RepID=A0A453MNC8_AEGTS